MPPPDGVRGRRVLAIWLPRWPVQRRLLEQPELRDVPVFVCRRGRRGARSVVSWAWAVPPRGAAGPRRDAGKPARSASRMPFIPPGMTLAEAMAVLALSHGSRACHAAVVAEDDPSADRAALVRLARWCRRFSPTCGLEAPDAPARTEPADGPAPECVLLDVTGTAGFFGGEAALARTAVWTLAARGLHARAAIADTATAARAAARHTDLLDQDEPAAGDRTSRPGACHSGACHSGACHSGAWWKPAARKRRWAVVPPGEAAAFLADLPLSALRLDRDALVILRELGIESIGGMLRLPADGLAARFPAQVARCRARFLGSLAEPWSGLAARPAFLGEGLERADPADTTDDDLPRAVEAFDLPVPCDDLGEDGIVAVIERLTKACVVPLAARGEGALALQVRLEEGTARPPVVIDVGLFRPSCSVPHLVDLARLRLGRCRPPRELAAVAVDVVAAGAALCRQRSLFTADTAAACDTAESQALAVGMLLDRLCGRLGRTAVCVPRAVADPQPEHAWAAAAPTEPASAADAGQGRRPMGGRRPVWMPPRPMPLRLSASPSSPVPASAGGDPAGGPAAGTSLPVDRFWLHGRWHRVATAHGPERIETAWWRGPTVRRDYYVVETESGGRFWLFRRRRDGRWFLHGIFA